MMNKALAYYHHGLGDVIMLTPFLRHLGEWGYKIDLMAREEVESSHLLENCPYINKLIEVDNPWQANSFDECLNFNIEKFKALGGNYDWMGMAPHLFQKKDYHKLHITGWELGLFDLEDYTPEVYVTQTIEDEMKKYIAENYPEGYIFKHTQIEHHEFHNWDADEWIKETLPDLPIVDTGIGGNYYMKWKDVNKTFVLLKYATHRVLSSSIFVHACEAMNLTMDVINYGRPDRKVWPMNQDLVIRIREAGQWFRNPKLELEEVMEKGLSCFDTRHQKVLKEVEKYDNILEIGPGTGKASLYLLMQEKDVELMDNKENGLIDFQNICDDTDYTYGITIDEDNSAGFSDNTYECVFACEVIEHIPDYKQAVNNMIKWASEKVIITCPVKRSYYSPDHVHFFKEEDFEFISEECKKQYSIAKIVTKRTDYETGQRAFYIEISCKKKGGGMLSPNQDSTLSNEIKEEYFKDKDNGFFVEAGAANGISGSVCYDFEKSWGWTGINVEANEYFWEALNKNRPDAVNLQFALSDKDGKDVLTLPQYEKGFKYPGGSSLIMWNDKPEEEGIECYEEMEVNTITYHTLCKENNITGIDLFSLDIEGAELLFLSSIQKDDPLPYIWVIEHDKVGIKELNKRMSELGYVQDKKITSNVIYRRII